MIVCASFQTRSIVPRRFQKVMSLLSSNKIMLKTKTDSVFFFLLLFFGKLS